MPLDGYYSVKHYGAVGDGITDDTIAIEAAETACETATSPGGVVYFPPGTFLVSNTITIAGNGVQWLGTGQGSSKILTATPSPIPIDYGGAPSAVEVTGSLVTIKGIGFIGNGIPPATKTPPTIAPRAIYVLGGTRVRVCDCYFTQNQGFTLEFQTVLEAEVIGCRFYEVGYNDRMNSTNAYHTQAIQVDSTSSLIQIHDNRYEMCNFGGNHIQGALCDSSHNCMSKVYWAANYFDQNAPNTRIAFNSAYDSQRVGTGGAGATGVYGNQAVNFCIIGNMVHLSDGDGIAVNGWSFGSMIGNTSWNNCQVTNDCGFQVLAQPAGRTANSGLAVIGNAAFIDSDAGSGQQYGIHILSPQGSLLGNCPVLGNSFHDNLSQGIIEKDLAAQDDSNAILGNSYWLERIHSSAPASTSGTTLTQLRSQQVSGGSLRPRAGIRIRGGGISSGTSAGKRFRLSFVQGTTATGNLLDFTTSGSAAGIWQILAVVMNNDTSESEQGASVELYFNGTVVRTATLPALTIQTNAAPPPNYLILEAQAMGGDSITNNFLMIERC